MKLFGRELTLEQVIGLVETNAQPDEDLVHRAALAIIAALREAQRRERAAGCDGCEERGQWEEEVEYGYHSPCTRCKRRCADNWRGPREAGKGGRNDSAFDTIYRRTVLDKK